MSTVSRITIQQLDSKTTSYLIRPVEASEFKNINLKNVDEPTTVSIILASGGVLFIGIDVIRTSIITFTN